MIVYRMTRVSLHSFTNPPVPVQNSASWMVCGYIRECLVWLLTLALARPLPGSVEESPRVRIEPRFIEVAVGDPVTMQCLATGYPEPQLQWMGATNPDAQFANGFFTIPAVRKSDEREYKCVATNSAGETSVRTIIYVRGGETKYRRRHLPGNSIGSCRCKLACNSLSSGVGITQCIFTGVCILTSCFSKGFYHLLHVNVTLSAMFLSFPPNAHSYLCHLSL